MSAEIDFLIYVLIYVLGLFVTWMCFIYNEYRNCLRDRKRMNQEVIFPMLIAAFMWPLTGPTGIIIVIASSLIRNLNKRLEDNLTKGEK